MRITVSALGFLNLIVAAYGFIPNGPGRWGCAERKMTLLYQPKDVNELTDAASTLMSKLESLIDKLEQPEKQNEQSPDDIFLQDLSTTMSSKVQPQLMQVEHMIQSISSPSTDEYTVIDARRVLDAIDLHHAWRSLADCMESVPLPLGPPSTAHNINFLELPTASQLQEALKCALQDALSAPDADAQRAVYTVMGHLESYVVSFRHELDSLEAAASHHVAAAGTHAVEAVHDSTQAELEVTATATTATMDAVLEPPATAAEETVQSLEKSELDPAQANLLEQQLSQARQELEDFAEVSENPFLDPQPAAIDAEVTREEGSVYQLYDEAREELEDFTLQVNAHIGGESEEAIVVGDSVEGFVQAEKLVTANGAALPPSITAFTTNTPAASFGLENGIGDAGAATPQFTYGADDAIPLADAATPQAQFAYGQSGYDVEEVLDEAQIELEQFMSSALEEAPMPNEEAMSHPEEYEATHVDPVPQVETETTFVEPAAEQPEMRNESTQPDLNSVTQVQDDMPVSPDPPLQESASEQNAPYFVEEAPTDQSEPLVQVFEESVEQVLDEAHRDLEDFNIPTYSQPYDKTARADFSSPDENNIGGGTPDWVNTGPVKHEPAEDWFNPVPPNPAAPTAQQATDTARKDFSAPLETNIGGGQPDWVGGGGASFGDEPDWIAEIQTSSFSEEVDQAFASRDGVESHVTGQMDEAQKDKPIDPPLKEEPPPSASAVEPMSVVPADDNAAAAATPPEAARHKFQANLHATLERADEVHRAKDDGITNASTNREPIDHDKWEGIAESEQEAPPPSEPLVQLLDEAQTNNVATTDGGTQQAAYDKPNTAMKRMDFSSPVENNIGGGTPDWVNAGPVKHEPAEDWFNPVPPTSQQATDDKPAKKDFSAPLETNIGGGQPDWVGGGGSFGDEPDWVAEIQTSSFREEVDQAFASRNGVESHVLDKMDDIGAQHKPIPADPPLKKEPPMNAPRTKNQSSPPHQNAASTKPETPGPNLQANASPKRADKVHKEQKDVTTSASAKRKPIKQDKSKPQVSQLSKEGPVSNAPQGTKSSQNRRDPAAKAVQPKRPVGSSPSNSAKSKSAKPPRPQAQKKTETAKKIHLEVKEDFKTFSLEKAAVPKVSVEVVVPVAVPEVITEVEEKVSVKEVVDVEVLAERMLSAKNVWESFSPIKIQGGSRRSYFAHGVKRVQVLLKTDGTPLTANVEVWNGPDNVPQKINVFIEEGSERTFNVVVETPEDETSLSIKNTGPMGFPMWAAVVDDLGDDVIPGLVALAKSTNDVKRIDGESSNMYAFGPEVGSVAVLLKTNGRPLHARIELMQGANTNKQVMEVYTEDGITRPFLAVIETPGAGNVVRVVNTGSLEYPLEAFVEPYQSESESAVAKGWNTGGTCVWDTDLIV